MAQPFLGEIRPFPYDFAPTGWALCQGQLLAISQYAVLFSILGTQYGGDGTTNFALPNLQGTVPVGQGQGPGRSPYVVGQTGGAEAVTLTSSQMPSHNHQMLGALVPASARGPSATAVPGVGHGAARGVSFNVNTYTSQPPSTNLAPNAIGAAGGSTPHNNMQPSLTISWCIAIAGIVPSRS